MAAIDINSPCSRVDFVTALASQLKLQVAQQPHSIPADDAQRKLQSKLDAVDQAVKSGDPQKAEQALFDLQFKKRRCLRLKPPALIGEAQEIIHLFDFQPAL